MPSLRDLKKRLQSVKTTGQLAGAMRTVSTAKYSRASSLLKQNSPYAAACRELLCRLVKPKLALRYVVAAKKRNLLWDMLPEQIFRSRTRHLLFQRY